MKLGQVLPDELTMDLRSLLGRLFTGGYELGLNLKELLMPRLAQGYHTWHGFDYCFLPCWEVNVR